VLWDRKTGEPLHRAIVWQDRRTEPFCAALRASPEAADIRARTGLVIDPQFLGHQAALAAGPHPRRPRAR
jgi:glycerol kinase